MNGSTTEAREAAETAVLTIVREVLGRPAIKLDDDLFDHGATSLSFVRVLASIRQNQHVVVHPAELTEVTARGLAAYVLAASDAATQPPAKQKIGA